MRERLVLAFAAVLVVLTSGAQAPGVDFVTGSFEQLIAIQPSAADPEGFLRSETELAVRINWQELEIAPSLQLSELQSSSLEIEAAYLADVVQYRTHLGFDLAKPESHFWWGEWEANAFGVTFGTSYLLVSNPWDPTPEDLKADFSFHGQTLNGMSVTVTTTFGDYVDPTAGKLYMTYGRWPNTGDTDGVCDLDFQRTEIVWVPLPLCCAEPLVEASFGCSGFEQMTFSVRAVGVERVPWLKFDASLSFSPETKSMTITPWIYLGAFEGCLSVVWAQTGVVEGNAPGGPTAEVESIDIMGLRLTCTLGTVEVNGFFYPEYSMIYASGRGDEKSSDPCCPGDFQWTMIATFQNTGGTLFGLSNAVVRLQYLLAPRFLLTTSVSYSAPSRTSLEFGFHIAFGD